MIRFTGRTEMVVYQCDLCGKMRDCVQKIIEQKEYDFCFRCWSSLAKKLCGKGRRLGQAEVTLIPSQTSKHNCIEEEPTPEESPEIFGGLKKPKPN
jgi:hypothetical protein